MPVPAAPTKTLPRLVDLGAAKCVPCKMMAPVLAIAFQVGSTDFLYGAILLLAYGVGHCAVIIAAGTSTELVQHFLNWNEKSRGIAVVKFLCGILVLLGGVYMLVSA